MGKNQHLHYKHNRSQIDVLHNIKKIVTWTE